MASTVQYGSAIDLAKSTVAPRVFKTGPPNYYTQTAFPKRLDVSANFTVDDSLLSASTFEKVPTSTGILTWQPNRGAGSIYHWGIVPQGAHATTGTQGLSMATAGAGTTTVTYASATAVPYNSVNSTDIVRVSPDLSQSFSQVRVYSGDVRVICDTVPIGNTALNGYFSAGALADSRDVSQVSEGAQPFNCFDPSDLVQTSVTSKDGLKEVSVMKGIVMLVGSDIQPFYTPPQTDETDVVNAGWARLSAGPSITQATAPLAAGTGIFMLKSWISPWNLQVADSAYAGQTLNVNTGPINLNGVLDFQFYAGLGGNAAPNAPGCLQQYTIQFDHIFATVTSMPTYACTYTTVTTQDNYLLQDNNTAGEQIIVESNPRMFQIGLTQTGIYLGTQVSIYFNNYSFVASTTAPVPTTNCYINYRARSLYNQGELGPTRVTRWDGMSNQQQIKIDGVINAQCIPEGNIAPFVQSAAMYSDTAHNLNAVTFLAELYNGESPFRRNWTGEAYDDFMRTVFPNLSPDLVQTWQQPKLLAIAKGAGIFDMIKPLLGTLGGGMVGSMVGSKLGLSAGMFGAASKYSKKRGPGRPKKRSASSSRASSVASSRGTRRSKRTMKSMRF